MSKSKSKSKATKEWRKLLHELIDMLDGDKLNGMYCAVTGGELVTYEDPQGNDVEIDQPGAKAVSKITNLAPTAAELDLDRRFHTRLDKDAMKRRKRDEAEGVEEEEEDTPSNEPPQESAAARLLMTGSILPGDMSKAYVNVMLAIQTNDVDNMLLAMKRLKNTVDFMEGINVSVTPIVLEVGESAEQCLTGNLTKHDDLGTVVDWYEGQCAAQEDGE
jgi:hypothetical protein